MADKPTPQIAPATDYTATLRTMRDERLKRLDMWRWGPAQQVVCALEREQANALDAALSALTKWKKLGDWIGVHLASCDSRVCVSCLDATRAEMKRLNADPNAPWQHPADEAAKSEVS